MIVTRFAPSPTGYLHVGNLRAALFSWAVARRAGGRFILRLDDTDAERSRPELAEAIRADLGWLGLDWDESFRQSDRLGRYHAAADLLRAAGRLYPCWETEAELEVFRRVARAAGRPPVYDRAALRLTEAEKARLAAERPPHWRFRLDPGRVGWQDAILGAQSVDAESLSDPVLIRGDGQVLYTLASVVDDAETGVTHVVRGADHITNTAVQIGIFTALGATPPDFGHHSLLTGPGGAGLSKRDGALALRDLRAAGVEPLALLSLIARLGSADPVELRQTHAEIVAGFDLSRFGAAPTALDPADLGPLTARLLHAMPYPQAAARLRALGIPDAVASEFWATVQGNLATMAEAADWWAICLAAPGDPPEDPAFAATARALLPPRPWDGTTWGTWTKAVQAATGAKGRALFQPLRRLLTGRDHGPEMARLMPLLEGER